MSCIVPLLFAFPCYSTHHRCMNVLIHTSPSQLPPLCRLGSCVGLRNPKFSFTAPTEPCRSSGRTSRQRAIGQCHLEAQHHQTVTAHSTVYREARGLNNLECISEADRRTVVPLLAPQSRRRPSSCPVHPLTGTIVERFACVLVSMADCVECMRAWRNHHAFRTQDMGVSTWICWP